MLKSDQLKKLFPLRAIKALKRLQPPLSRKIQKTASDESIRTHQQNLSKPKLYHLFFNKTLVRRAVSRTFHPFCRESSIHGLKHLFMPFGEHELRGNAGKYIFLTNKIVWTTAVSCCATFCLYLMVISYLNFFATLTTTTIESINYPISEVAFPAVTFCSINKVYKPNTRMIKELA